MNVEIQKYRALSLPFIHREGKEEEISGLNIIIAIRAACNSQSTPRLTCNPSLVSSKRARCTTLTACVSRASLRTSIAWNVAR